MATNREVESFVFSLSPQKPILLNSHIKARSNFASPPHFNQLEKQKSEEKLVLIRASKIRDISLSELNFSASEIRS